MGVVVKNNYAGKLDVVFVNYTNTAMIPLFMLVLFIFGALFASLGHQEFTVRCSRSGQGALPGCTIINGYYFGLFKYIKTVDSVSGVIYTYARSGKRTHKEVMLKTAKGNVSIMGGAGLAVSRQVKGRLLNRIRSHLADASLNDFTIHEISESKPAFIGYPMMVCALLGLLGWLKALLLPCRTTMDKGGNLCFIREYPGRIRLRSVPLSMIRQIKLVDDFQLLQSRYPKMANKLQTMLEEKEMRLPETDRSEKKITALCYTLKDKSEIVQHEQSLSREEWENALRAMKAFARISEEGEA
jgi:hypothetical protein